MVAPRLIPAHSRADAERLVRRLLAEPAAAGRLRDAQLGELSANYSGAFLVQATWDDQPAIAKVGATPREVQWAQDLARVDPDLIPTLYASGDALGDEPLAWIVMERCRHEVGWQWGGAGYGMLLEAGVRFQLASRRIAPPVGPADVDPGPFFALAHEALTTDPPAPGPAATVLANAERDWAWVVSHCRVELCHGDLHPANAVSRAAPPHPEARALLIDHAPAAMPWASEPARCEILYWRTQTPRGEPTLVHAMAAIRRRHGLEVPRPADLDRLSALFLAWHALRLWPYTQHRQIRPEYPEAARAYVEAAARL
jgi:hypothetical protein